MQLLKLLFYRSKNQVHLKRSVRPTRGNMKIKFNVMSRTTTKYLNSPFLRGTVLWDVLSTEIQKAESMYEFKKQLKKRYKEYDDLL